jgi:AcrR family transcriptional regulator
MYQMVRFVVTTSQARSRLLDLAVSHAMHQGIADLSLRELAAAIGTSHRMLLYHFGSREGLLLAVTDAVEERQREATFGDDVDLDGFTKTWERVSDPSLWPQERLFFELYSLALRDRPGLEGFLDRAMESWLGPATDSLVADGADPGDARADARLGLAVVRGLLLDLLATGDREGVQRAFERFIGLAMNVSPGVTQTSDDT